MAALKDALKESLSREKRANLLAKEKVKQLLRAQKQHREEREEQNVRIESLEDALQETRAVMPRGESISGMSGGRHGVGMRMLRQVVGFITKFHKHKNMLKAFTALKYRWQAGAITQEKPAFSKPHIVTFRSPSKSAGFLDSPSIDRLRSPSGVLSPSVSSTA